MDDDLHSTITEAVNEVNAADQAASQASNAPAPVPPTGAPPAPTPPVGAPPAAPAAPTPPAGTPPAPTPPAAPGSPEATGKPEDEATKHNLGTVIAKKAPGTWSPAAREHWNTLKPEVQAEIIKRESETSRAMTQSASARRFASEFNQIMAPHAAFFAADGVQPLQAVQQVMQQAAVLRVGTGQQKAGLIAGLVKHFGIDIEALDQALHAAGFGAQDSQPQPRQQPAFDPNQITQLVRQELAPILQQRNQQHQMLLSEVQQQVDAEWDAFANDPKHEFVEDVKAVMADLMEVARKHGVNMGLTDAYERATLLVPSVRDVIEKRKQQANLQSAHQVAQQAKAGAFGIQNSANTGVAAPVDEDDGTIAGALAASIRLHSGGR